MKIFEDTLPLTYHNDIFLNIPIEETIIFDIETTGFSSKSTYLYLIGCIYFDKSSESFRSIQWLMDSYDDEPSIINMFFEFAKNFKYIITYNGLGFDIPYINEKCKTHNISYNFSSFYIFDIYKDIYPFKNILGLPNIKQKSIENFLDINRNDIYNGGQLISVFSEYINTKSQELMDMLILHNKEDIIGLYNILHITNYISIFKSNYTINSLEIIHDKDNSPKEIIVICNLLYTLPKRISFGNNTYYVSAYNNTMKIKISVYNGGLKFFYQNYKDYYYLPMEDRSIHKSIAFYVDKNYRTKANAANCYSKKTGRFIPQYEEIISPYFKIDYSDKITYFELTNEIINQPDLIKNYIDNVLMHLK